MSTATVDIAQDEAAAVVSAGGDIAARSPLQLFLRRLRADKVALAAAIVIVLLIIVAIDVSFEAVELRPGAIERVPHSPERRVAMPQRAA